MIYYYVNDYFVCCLWCCEAFADSRGGFFCSSRVGVCGEGAGFWVPVNY